MNFRFAEPWFLLALVLVPIVMFWRIRRGGAAFGAFAIAVRAVRPSRGPLLFRLLVALALGALAISAASVSGSGRRSIVTNGTSRVAVRHGWSSGSPSTLEVMRKATRASLSALARTAASPATARRRSRAARLGAWK